MHAPERLPAGHPVVPPHFHPLTIEDDLLDEALANCSSLESRGGHSLGLER